MANQFYVVKIPLTAVPTSNLDRYEDALRGVVAFLDNHRDIVEKLRLADADEFRDRYRGDSSGALERIRNIVGADKLMVLVDEHDRAPMTLYSKLAPTFGSPSLACWRPSSRSWHGTRVLRHWDFHRAWLGAVDLQRQQTPDAQSQLCGGVRNDERRRRAAVVSNSCVT